MSDTNQAPETTKRQIAKHGWVDADGNPCERIEDATGNSYIDLATGKQILNIFDVRSPDSKHLKALLMFALFGWRTLATNEASAWRQAFDKGDDDLASDQVAAIEERMAQIFDENVWRERGEGGGRGPKYDPMLICSALVEVLADGAKGDAAHYLERYTTDKSYAAKVRSNPQVQARYWALAAEAGKAAAGAGSLA